MQGKDEKIRLCQLTNPHLVRLKLESSRQKVRRFSKNVGLFPKNVGDFLKNVGDFFKNVGDFFSPSPCILSKDVEMMRKGLIFSINSPRLNG